MTAADKAYFAAASGRAPSQSAQLPREVLAVVLLLLAVSRANAQQLRARGLAQRKAAPGSHVPLTLDPNPTQRDQAVQKFAAAQNAAFDDAIRGRALQPVTAILDPLVSNVGTIGKGALGAAAVAGIGALGEGFAAGAGAFGTSLAASGTAITAGLASAAAALPFAAPAVDLAVLGSIIVPTITSGELFSGSVDPYFDATTAAAQKRAAAQAVLIKQDLLSSGTKFARRGAVDPTTILGG